MKRRSGTNKKTSSGDATCKKIGKTYLNQDNDLLRVTDAEGQECSNVMSLIDQQSQQHSNRVNAERCEQVLTAKNGEELQNRPIMELVQATVAEEMNQRNFEKIGMENERATSVRKLDLNPVHSQSTTVSQSLSERKTTDFESIDNNNFKNNFNKVPGPSAEANSSESEGEWKFVAGKKVRKVKKNLSAIIEKIVKEDIENSKKKTLNLINIKEKIST